MEKLQVYPNRSVEWTPSAVVALAVSPDGAQLAAAREDGSLEIWLVSPGSVGWHCQLTIQGDPDSRVSSLVWCCPSQDKGSSGCLLSSSIDGTISEWDLFSVQKNVVLDSIGVSIWQMAVEPFCDLLDSGITRDVTANGHTKHDFEDESEITQDDDDSDTDNLHTSESRINSQRLAVACDDGCVRLYTVSSGGRLAQNRSFPRVSGRILSVAWSQCANLIFSGSSDGLIRCWNVASLNEVYRITVGLGGAGSGPEVCIWSLLSLRSGTLVSGDSTGSVQFWDIQQGTLLQAHTYHKGDVTALAAIPGHSRVFSAGSDGQVVLYKLNDTMGSDFTKAHTSKWIYVGYVRSHTHDIRALAMAVPISEEVPNDKVLKVRRRENNFSYQKWAHLGVPMLISGGDDTKLFAYSAREFTQYSPHDICPAPQRPLVKLVHDTVLDGTSVMLIQSSGWLDISLVRLDDDTSMSKPIGRKIAMQPLARVKGKGSKRIICSAVSNTGMLVSYSDNVKPCLFELKRHKLGKNRWSIEKLVLPKGLPYAHSMLFSADSSCLILAGHDRKIYIVDVRSSKVIHTFVPQRKMNQTASLPNGPPVVKMFNSADGQWLAAINCFGDIYIFNLEIYRQHWFISRLNGSSITAGGFPPKNSNVLVLTTSSNKVYVFDVEAKELGEWSRRHTYHLPRRFQEFPGEVIGLSFPPSSCSSSVIIYSARAMCFVDFGMPVDEDELPNGLAFGPEKHDSNKTATTKRKRNYLGQDSKPNNWRNFDILVAKDPALFVGHMSESSLLLIEKQWMDVVKNFGAPVHRHIYGT